MHCHCCLPRTGRPLYDQVHLRGTADHCVLLFLDRGNDLTQDSAFVSCKIFREKFVICHNIRIIEIKEPVVGDLISAFALQVDLAAPLAFDCVTAAPHRIFIVYGRHGSAPVYDGRFGTVFRNAHTPYIIGFRAGKLRIAEIDPAEIRLSPCFPAADEISLILP